MSGLSKCEGKGCKKKNTCLRFLAKSDPEWQSWSDFDKQKGKCEYYIKVEKEK
jgi:hypothetical protein